MSIQKTAANQQTDDALLVFPATHPEGRGCIEAALRRNEKVIGATSAPADVEFAGFLIELEILPYVYEPDFSTSFLQLVSSHKINRIFSPVSAVHKWLEQFIIEQGLEISLLGEPPFKQELDRCKTLFARTALYTDFVSACAESMTAISVTDIAAAFRLANNIYGESNEHKIAAMVGAFASAPRGDVIEIGVLAGKSSAVLAFLARRNNLGNVLAIDPWRADIATQKNSPASIKKALDAEWEDEALFNDFLVNTLPVGVSNLNYVRDTSESASIIYRASRTISSPEFGSVQYRGGVSILHIDGNHDYEHVKRDCTLWLPLLLNGGWLILDDYIWIHGDGPRRVGNTLLEQHATRIDRAFVCGKALFAKFVSNTEFALDKSCD